MAENMTCPYCNTRIHVTDKQLYEDISCLKCKGKIPGGVGVGQCSIVSVSIENILCDYADELQKYMERYRNESWNINYNLISLKTKPGDEPLERQNGDDDMKYSYKKIRYYNFGFIRENRSNIAETKTIVLKTFQWRPNENFFKQIEDHLNHADVIILNIDVTKLPALYYNLDVKENELAIGWNFEDIYNMLEEFAFYWSQSSGTLNCKIAIMLGKMEYLRRYPLIKSNGAYRRLLQYPYKWDCNSMDRLWIKEENEIIREFLTEIHEKKLFFNDNKLLGAHFFLFPQVNSCYEMDVETQNCCMFSPLLWACDYNY